MNTDTKAPESPMTASSSPTPPNGTSAASSQTAANARTAPPKAIVTNANGTNHPPPKTDKPRPHVCGTCGRSFARLEHLKRHERSHTKEKPFECPECARCFARRDLLLRHQQKLHMTTTASSRPRAGRRESTSSAVQSSTARVRKNSIANGNVGGTGGAGTGAGRPRANTISHIDGASLNLMANASTPVPKTNPLGTGHGHSHHASLNGFAGPSGFDYRGMSTAMGNHGFPNMPLKLDTHGLNIDLGSGLRTAPAFGGPTGGFNFDTMFSPGSTINPAQLHFNDAMATPSSQFSAFPPFQTPMTTMEEDESTDWMRGFDNQLTFAGSNDNALDESSPSALSAHSQAEFNNVMLDGSNKIPQTSGAFWSASLMGQPVMAPSQFGMDTMGQLFPDMTAPPDTVSPQSLHDVTAMPNDALFATPPPLSALSPASVMSVMPGLQNQYFLHGLQFPSDSQSISSSSVNGSARQSSVTSVSTESITDATRQALLISLSQSASFGQSRKYSLPRNSSTSPDFAPKLSTSLPSTQDLQRFVSAYIQYFHAHLPFLHIPTLSFDSPAFTSILKTPSSHAGLGSAGIVGGGGCLILSMAAIGALYEFDHAASKELFEAAKKMITLYIDERRRADMAAAVNGATPENNSQNTPLWLVQAMLLNVIYGHNCGDRTAAEIASTHCAALVSLARSAGLAKQPDSTDHDKHDHFTTHSTPGDVDMVDSSLSPEGWQNLHSSVHPEQADDNSEWLRWRAMEERKRTLYTVFILSSLLVSAYNSVPAILNSEIQLDLPCEEDLWAAESAQAWRAKGGSMAAEQSNVRFADALSHLLTAYQRQPTDQHTSSGYRQPFGSGMPLENLPESDLKPSTFGCLILINALHNYIWDSRERHVGRQWTNQEIDSMHAHVEPALRAWLAAWASNPRHSLERPNPHGPLSADSIPLLDLAYIRLFVNLGKSKEAFFQRDFERMSEEIARGAEIVPYVESPKQSAVDAVEATRRASLSSGSPSAIGNAASSPSDMGVKPSALMQPPTAPNTSGQVPQPGQSSKRERHLRRAAFYAADSLANLDKLGVTFAEFTSRELPIQSAMCTFDCAQVLAEWITTVQERVGRYIGVLGRDEIDFSQVPCIMLLEDEDIKLIEQINEFLASAELKMQFEIGNMSASAALNALSGLPSQSKQSYGAKILLATAFMMEKAAVWPITRVMARALDTQASHMNRRSETSATSIGIH